MPADPAGPREPIYGVGCSPAETIEDELAARGWTTYDLAMRMGGDVGVNQLAVDLLLACRWRGCLVGAEMAEQLHRAFGVSAQFWLNLDAAWQKVAPEMPANDVG